MCLSKVEDPDPGISVGSGFCLPNIRSLQCVSAKVRIRIGVFRSDKDSLFLKGQIIIRFEKTDQDMNNCPNKIENRFLYSF